MPPRIFRLMQGWAWAVSIPLRRCRPNMCMYPPACRKRILAFLQTTPDGFCFEPRSAAPLSHGLPAYLSWNPVLRPTAELYLYPPVCSMIGEEPRPRSILLVHRLPAPYSPTTIPAPLHLALAAAISSGHTSTPTSDERLVCASPWTRLLQHPANDLVASSPLS